MDFPYALPSLSSSISNEDFCQFHRIDRQLYWVLVINLSRDPIESMQVLALFLWLERVGYRHLVNKITSLQYVLINKIADETVSCLRYLKTYTFSYFSYMSYPMETCNISLLQMIVEKEISSPLLYDNRDLALKGVTEIMTNVCATAFGDIMKQAITRNAFEKMAAQKRMVEQNQELQQQQQNQELQQQQNQELQQQQFLFGSIDPSYLQNASNYSAAADHHHQFPEQNQTVENHHHEEEVPEDERTLFLTFSKGFPVAEWEVKEFFTILFGDAVEGLFMQEVQPGEQALYARIVFRCESIVDMIIQAQGSTKAKFCINGKHVWARKFVPRRTNNVLPIPTHNNNYTGESSGTTGMI